MNGLDSSLTFMETPIWFGPRTGPLLGWLSTPPNSRARGGILLAPPIGREWRACRYAFRDLAQKLTALGFVTLRFDYHGVGDSSGTVEVENLDEQWVNDVQVAASLLRSYGLSSISAVGMRFGATLVAIAAVRHQLDFSSVVLWDPCESGKSYLRQLSALESLRRQTHSADNSEFIETTEMTFSSTRGRELRRLSLTQLEPGRMAQRVLVITRDDRSVPKALNDRLNQEHTEWRLTTEQGSLIDIEPLLATMPTTTIRGIASWLDDESAFGHEYKVTRTPRAAIVRGSSAGAFVHERCIELGSGRLFGIVAEPIGQVRGPLIVFVNVSNEDHTGPSRLWVDLSRRWAALGARCVRFDLSGLGDSPYLPGQSITRIYESQWLAELRDVSPSLIPESPQDVVYVGLCSGALLAIDAALVSGARGVCAIGPPNGMAFLRTAMSLRRSRRHLLQLLGDRLKWAGMHLGTLVTLGGLLTMLALPLKMVDGGFSKVNERGVDLLVLIAEDELQVGRLARLRRYALQRMMSLSAFEIEVVPHLDHSMFSAKGRREAVVRLDRFILKHLTSDAAAT